MMLPSWAIGLNTWKNIVVPRETKQSLINSLHNKYNKEYSEYHEEVKTIILKELIKRI